MPRKSRKEILNEFKGRLKKEYPDAYKLYVGCVESNKREFVSMEMFAEKIGAPKPALDSRIDQYLNEIWLYITRYKP